MSNFFLFAYLWFWSNLFDCLIIILFLSYLSSKLNYSCTFFFLAYLIIFYYIQYIILDILDYLRFAGFAENSDFYFGSILANLVFSLDHVFTSMCAFSF